MYTATVKSDNPGLFISTQDHGSLTSAVNRAMAKFVNELDYLTDEEMELAMQSITIQVKPTKSGQPKTEAK